MGRAKKADGHAYDGYSPAGVTTLAAAKREALYGAGLKDRPSRSHTPSDGALGRQEGSVRDEHVNNPAKTEHVPPTCKGPTE